MAHENIIKIITNLIDSDNLPHLLLYGPPGTGKTRFVCNIRVALHRSERINHQSSFWYPVLTLFDHLFCMVYYSTLLY